MVVKHKQSLMLISKLPIDSNFCMLCEILLVCQWYCSEYVIIRRKATNLQNSSLEICVALWSGILDWVHAFTTSKMRVATQTRLERGLQQSHTR